jgi:predicted nucleotidyltransferase
MKAADVSQVWSVLDRARLAEVARSGPEPLFATISGAHLYGFASPNSDVDLRGAFVLPVRDLLALGRPHETHSISRNDDDLELDWVAHDVRKFVRMMIRDNGYVLEQLFSPLVVVGGPNHDELRELGRGCVTRGLVRHYRGFARGRRTLLDKPGATVKHLLYAYRVYLTGIHALTSGSIESHLPVLNELFGLSHVTELIVRKREGAEKTALEPGEIERHRGWLDELEVRLDAAHAASTLPVRPTTIDALDEFVVRVRMRREEARR